MNAFRTWRDHLRSLRLRSYVVALAALFIAGFVLFVMFKTNNYSIVPMSFTLLMVISGIAILVPKPTVQYLYALIALILALRAVVTGEFLFAVSSQSAPLLYWGGVAIMFAASIWLLYYAHKTSDSPPNPTVETDAREGGARGSL
jgi:hypothetical protein